MKYKVGIVGLGFVGTAVETGLQNVSNIEIHTHDKYKDTESLRSVVYETDVIFLCLPTPMNEDRSCNTSIIKEVVNNINIISDSTKTIVIKSTVPPGTTGRLAIKYPKHTFIFNPEFLTERNFIDDFLNQDRIFLGVTPGYNKLNLKKITDLYQNFCNTQTTPGNLFVVDSDVAEMLKYTTNSFLATKVSFFNEIYDICKGANINYKSVIELLKMDKRIGKSHMQVPGHENKRGWGGSCFPKDLNALVVFAEKHGIDALMLEAAWVKNLTVRDGYEWEELAQVTGEYDKE